MKNGDLIKFPFGRTIIYNSKLMSYWSYADTPEDFIKDVFEILPQTFVFSRDKNKTFSNDELETYFFRLLDEHDEEYVYHQFMDYSHFRSLLDNGIGSDYNLIGVFYADEE